MRATMTTNVVVAVVLFATAGAHAQECTRNHELYRIVPEHRTDGTRASALQEGHLRSG